MTYTPTESQRRFANEFVRHPEYPEMIDALRNGAFALFEATMPTEPAELQEARMMLTAIVSLDGLLKTWAGIDETAPTSEGPEDDG